MIRRRTLLASTAVLAATASQAQERPYRIAVSDDMSGMWM